MAGAVAEAGAAEKAAESLSFRDALIDHTIAKTALAGCSHARKLPAASADLPPK